MTDEFVNRMSSMLEQHGEIFSRFANQLEREATRCKTERDALMAMRDDPVVIVRRYGSRGAFHSARSPCGHVPHPDDFRRLLLGEAMTRGHRPCRVCGYTT